MQVSRRDVLKGTLGTGAALLAPGLARAWAKAPADGWELPEPRPFAVTEHQWIPMADGVRLSARLWIPDGADKQQVPVVLEYIPYRKRDLYRPIDSLWGAALASYGIAFARVDVRGTGDSEGIILDEYSEAELADGVAVLQWLSQQPWSSGAAGMRGLSWGGINTLQIAARQPAALRAVMVIAGSDNRFTDDAHYHGGALGRASFRWGGMFKGVMAAPPDPQIVGERWEQMWRDRLEASPPILAEWTRHQTFDAYWQRGSVALDYDAIKVPTYVVAGWQDTYAHPMLRLLENLNCPRKGLIGPWGHTYPYLATPSGLQWAFEEVRWWSQWLGGEQTGIMQEPMLRTFMPYQTARQSHPERIPGRWIAEATWPPRDATPVQLYLGKEGLSAEQGPDTQLAVPSGKVVGSTRPEWLERLPIDQSHDDSLSLVFDGTPLEEDIEILGSPVVALRLSANQPVAHVAVRMCEVTPDDRSWLVSYAIRNLTHRDSHTDPTPLEPHRTYDVSLPLHAMAHRFSKGSRLRVAVSESLWPLVWPSPVSPELTIVTGSSVLQLPVRKVERAQVPMPITPTELPAQPPAEYTPAVADADGRLNVDFETPPVPYQVPDVGTELTRKRTEHASMVPGEPNSCRWSASSSVTWRRADWNCEVKVDYSLTADPEHFILEERLRALEDGKLIFDRKHDNRIPRHLV